MTEIQSLYLQFLNYFPKSFQPIVSVVLAVFLVYSVFQVVKRNFIFLIVLVVLLPASVPILKGVVDAIVLLVKFLLGAK